MGNKIALFSLKTLLLISTDAVVRGETFVTHQGFKTPLSFPKAQIFCKNSGGQLSKLTTDDVKYDQDNPIYQVLAGLLSCAWIGMSDKEDEGDWRWMDGSRVDDSSINWKGNNGPFFPVQKHIWDCGILCDGNKIVEWGMGVCHVKRSFMCQYEIEMPLPTTTATAAMWMSEDDSKLEQHQTNQARTTEIKNKRQATTTTTRETCDGGSCQERNETKPTASTTETRIPLQNLFLGKKILAGQFNPRLKAKPDETKETGGLVECLRLCNELNICRLVNYFPLHTCAIYWDLVRAESQGVENVPGWSVWIVQARAK